MLIGGNWRTADAATAGLQLPATAAFFTRAHFDIFGLFFPLAVPDLRSAVPLLADLYLHGNVTMKLQHRFNVEVVRKSLGSAAGRPQVWQRELDTLTRLVCVRVLQHRPLLFLHA